MSYIELGRQEAIHRMREIKRDPDVIRYNRLAPVYGEAFSANTRVKGTAVFVMMAATLAFVSIALFYSILNYNNLWSNFTHFFTYVTPEKLMIGIGGSLLLIAGTAAVIYRARKSEDPLVNSTIFRSSNYEEQIEEAVFEYSKNERLVWDRAYIDKSTLDQTRSGKAYLYAVKDPDNHYLVSTMVILTTPIYTIATIAYHILRIVPVFFYMLVRSLNDLRKAPEEREFTLIDIIKEPARSLWHIVKAPFYGLAYFTAALFSLINPMGGRILAAKIERDWNDGKTRAEGWWFNQGERSFQKLFTFNRLLPTVFLAGCWQPIGVVEYQEGRMSERGKSLTEAVRARTGYIYTVFSDSRLEEVTRPLREEYHRLKEVHDLNEDLI